MLSGAAIVIPIANELLIITSLREYYGSSSRQDLVLLMLQRICSKYSDNQLVVNSVKIAKEVLDLLACFVAALAMSGNYQACLEMFVLLLMAIFEIQKKLKN